MELKVFNGHYGQAFFDDDKLIKYIHENDGSWQTEFNDIVRHFGIKVSYIEKPSKKQLKILKTLEEDGTPAY